jgi:hypothetical protein
MTGMNGSLASLILTLSVAAFLIRGKAGARDLALKLLGTAVLGVLPNVLLWVAWEPTSSTGQPQGTIQLAEKLFFLFGSSFNVAGFSDRWPVSLAVVIATILAAGLVIKQQSSGSGDLPQGTFAAGLLVSIVLLAAVASGRGGNYNEWNNVISMHYGVLTVFIPIFSWGIISISRNVFLRTSVALVLIVTSIFGYSINVAWKVAAQSSQNILIAKASADIAGGLDSLRVAEKHLSLLSWRLDKENRDMVKTGLDFLKSANLHLYPADALE